VPITKTSIPTSESNTLHNRANIRDAIIVILGFMQTFANMRLPGPMSTRRTPAANSASGDEYADLSGPPSVWLLRSYTL